MSSSPSLETGQEAAYRTLLPTPSHCTGSYPNADISESRSIHSVDSSSKISTELVLSPPELLPSGDLTDLSIGDEPDWMGIWNLPPEANIQQSLFNDVPPIPDHALNSIDPLLVQVLDNAALGKVDDVTHTKDPDFAGWTDSQPTIGVLNDTNQGPVAPEPPKISFSSDSVGPISQNADKYGLDYVDPHLQLWKPTPPSEENTSETLTFEETLLLLDESSEDVWNANPHYAT